MRKIFLFFLLLFPVVLSAGFVKKVKSDPVAVIKTTMGNIYVELYEKNAPKTVANFIGLATGKKEYYDYKSGKRIKGKFYDGIIFHRVIPNFMIQTGDPTGTGRGGPGYMFKDEINADSLGLNKLKVRNANFLFQMYPQYMLQKFINKSVKEFYEAQGYHYIKNVKSIPPRKGCVAMANAGPDTNGSQFFINEVDTPWLDGKHTVFGKVIKGFDVVKKIARVKTDRNNKPLKPVVIKHIIITK